MWSCNTFMKDEVYSRDEILPGYVEIISKTMKHSKDPYETASISWFK